MLQVFRYWSRVYKCFRKPNLTYGTICSNIINNINNHHNIFIYTKIEQSNSTRGDVSEGMMLCATQYQYTSGSFITNKDFVAYISAVFIQ